MCVPQHPHESSFTHLRLSSSQDVFPLGRTPATHRAPFYGVGGGVILESVICCTVCGKIKVAQGFGPNLLLILNDSKVGKGRGERNWIHVRKHHSKTREPVPKTVLKSHSGFCPALFSQFCRVGTEQLMVERCRGYNKKSVIAQSSETLPHLSRYL